MWPEILLKFASFKSWNDMEHLQTMKYNVYRTIYCNPLIESKNNLNSPKDLKAFKKIQVAPYI